MARVLAILALCMSCLLAGVEVAQAQAPGSSRFTGSVPSSGGIAVLALYQPAAVPSFVNELNGHGCDALSLTVTEQGALSTYIVGAPAFVNAQFPAQLEPQPLIVRCRIAPPAVDEHLLTLVTPDHRLDASFVPENLVALPAEASLTTPLYLTREAAEALTSMLEAADDAGHHIVVRSAYRSYAEQRSTFDYWVSLLGEAEAERHSARPGHSEHQLGTTVDLTAASVGWELSTQFAETAEGRWIANNAWRFGFVVSYPADAEAVTGYRFEPWHLRYIGKPHAEWLRTAAITLTEHLTALHEAR